MLRLAASDVLLAEADELATESLLRTARGTGELLTAADLADAADALNEAGISEAMAAGADVGAAATEDAIATKIDDSL
jgi:hypothetical protein